MTQGHFISTASVIDSPIGAHKHMQVKGTPRNLTNHKMMMDTTQFVGM